MKSDRFFYPILIVIVWVIAYIVSQILFDQKLGWDEVAYMSVAKGIANDFDYSARTYTVMGLIKHGYPAHFINFPVFSFYLAIFFKLFGASLKIAYFSTWLCALGVCLLIYFIFLMLSENSHKLAFLVSMSYLFCPGILKNCDTALMEQMGCFLICLSTYLLLKDYSKGVFNLGTLIKVVLSFLIIWLYKSLFIGFFFGVFLFILLAYNPKLSGKEIKTKFSVLVFILLSYGIFAVLFYLVKKFVFLPVAPMMTFTPRIEMNQTYADFLGGFLSDLPRNLSINISSFLEYIALPCFIYPTAYTNPTSQFFVFIPYVVCVVISFILFLIAVVLTFTGWKKLSPQARLFCGLMLGSITSFNVIFNFLFTTTFENVWRYNVYSLPFFLCYITIVFRANYDYLNPFVTDHPFATKTFIAILLVFVWCPLCFSMYSLQAALEERYHYRAKINQEVVKVSINNSVPAFIYFNDGIHTTFTDYPIKQIMKDATNEQLLSINKILPEPIEYLFLRPTDWLFLNNKELILKGAPILNEMYKFIGFNKDIQVVVYKLTTLGERTF